MAVWRCRWILVLCAIFSTNFYGKPVSGFETDDHMTTSSLMEQDSITGAASPGLPEICQDLNTTSTDTVDANTEMICINSTSDPLSTMNSSPHEDPYKLAKLVSKYIHLYGGAVTLLLGIPGNLLGCAILLRPRLRTLPGNIFLVLMTFSDFVFILTAQFLTKWLFMVSGVHFLVLDDWICKINTSLKYISSDFSKSNLLGLTMERCFSICFPMKAMHVVTPKLRRIYITVMFLWALVVNCLDFTSKSVILVGSSLKCEFEDSSLAYVKNGLHLTHNVSTSVGVMVLNIFMVITLIRHRTTVEQDLKTGQKSANQRNVTRMLLAVSFVFILCTTPACITQIIRSGGYHTPVQGVVLSYLMFLVFVNHAINVLLYFLSGSIFRREVKLVFHWMFGKQVQENSQSTSQTRMTAVTSAENKAN